MDKYEDDNLAVYIVWLPMLASDARDKWKPELIDDPRITHYWDQRRVTGKWFADQVPGCDKLGPVAWDAYYLFDKDTVWKDVPNSVVACGTPVYKATEPLAGALEKMFGEKE